MEKIAFLPIFDSFPTKIVSKHLPYNIIYFQYLYKADKFPHTLTATSSRTTDRS